MGAPSGSWLHGVLRELPLQTFRKQKQHMQGSDFWDWWRTQETCPKSKNWGGLHIRYSITVERCLGYGAPQRTQCLVLQILPSCIRCRGGDKSTSAPLFWASSAEGIGVASHSFWKLGGNLSKSNPGETASKEPAALKSWRMRQKKRQTQGVQGGGYPGGTGQEELQT